MNRPPVSAEQFSTLSRIPGIVHGFIPRIPGIDVAHDKATALQQLDGVHRAIRQTLGAGAMRFVTAEQVHGREIAIAETKTPVENCFAKSDGLITNERGLCFGIYVADCCAVYLVDPVQQAIGLVHSGRKGTELAIAPRAIAQMAQQFGSCPQDVIVQLSPCIRPPHYEVDFAKEIVRQCRQAGVEKVHDSGQCTACDPQRYYSYRAEKGRTGRMLALLALA